MYNLKRTLTFGVVLVISFFANLAFDLACGPEPDPFDYYVSFFHNTVNRNSDYWSFYFNGYTFLNDADEQVNEKDINVREWAAYTGKAVNVKDIRSILYSLNRKSDSIYFWNYSPNRRLPDSLQHNSFVQVLLKNKHAMSYLADVKKAEPLITRSYDDQWNPAPVYKKKLHEYGLAYLKKANQENDRFLKLRDYYEAQRLLHYGGFNREALAVYDEHIQKITSRSHVKHWALSLKAGELLHMGQKAPSAYLFSKLFVQCPERRVQAYHDFASTQAPIDQVIKQTGNNREQAYIYAIAGFHDPHIGLNFLRNIYSADPNSDLISVLLIREINKIEEGYLTPRLCGSKYYGSIGYYDHASYDSVKKSFVRYIPRLKLFCQRMATEQKYPKPALGYLASAYLSWIQQDASSGLKELDHLSGLSINGKLEDQKQLIRLLLMAQQLKTIDRTAEHQLLPSLTWLNNKVRQESLLKSDSNKFFGDYDLKYFSASSRDFYVKVLAPIYFRQRDTAMAALCILRGERTVYPDKPWRSHYSLGFDMPLYWQTGLHSCHLKQILQWENSRQKTPYLRLLTSDISAKIKSNMLELLGTAYLREHRYTRAAQTLHQIDGAKLNLAASVAYDSIPLYADPFTDRLRDYPKKYSSRPITIHNKYLFAKAMARLERQVSTDKIHAAQYTYALATGMYNTTYYGNAWFYTAYNWASEDRQQQTGYYYDNDYLKTFTAEKYYLKARGLSKDPEFKARCTFMAAKCRQKRMAYPEYPEYSDNTKLFESQQRRFDRQKETYNRQLRTSLYFKELKQQYSGTRFYRIAVHECSYLRDFINVRGR